MEPKKASNRLLVTYFLVAFAFSWFFWLIGVFAPLLGITLPFPNMVLAIIGAHGPLVAALSLTYRAEGWAGVKALLRSGFRLNIRLGAWLWALLVPFVLGGLAVWINTALSGYVMDRAMLEQPIMILPTFLIMFFLGGSFQEEFGWRGFALPRLLARWNPLLASLILGALWATWHLPLFLMSGVSQSYMNFGVYFFLVLGFTVLFTSLHLQTGGNIFAALLLHTAINTSLSVFPPIELKTGGNQAALTYLMLLYVLVAVLVVLKDWALWLKTPARQ